MSQSDFLVPSSVEVFYDQIKEIHPGHILYCEVSPPGAMGAQGIILLYYFNAQKEQVEQCRIDLKGDQAAYYFLEEVLGFFSDYGFQYEQMSQEFRAIYPADSAQEFLINHYLGLGNSAFLPANPNFETAEDGFVFKTKLGKFKISPTYVQNFPYLLNEMKTGKLSSF